MWHDYAEKSFGPLHYSRHDVAVLTIMRGRDHGLPDYQTARKALGLPDIRRFEDINPTLFAQDSQLLNRLRTLHGSVDKLDVFTGGLLEGSATGMGPLFKTVIKRQFERIRDGDRYWFENTDNRHACSFPFYVFC